MEQEEGSSAQKEQDSATEIARPVVDCLGGPVAEEDDQQRQVRPEESKLPPQDARLQQRMPPVPAVSFVASVSTVVNSRTWERFDLELGEIPVVRAAADTLQVTPMVVALGTLCATVGFLLYGFGGQFVCTLFGVAYPAFESFKVVEAFANLAEGTSTDVYIKASSMQFWLTYWIVVAMLASFEYVFWLLLIQIPFYFPLKLLFLLFLFSPVTRGANTVYNWLVSPILRRNRHRIDSALEESNRKFSESARRLQNKLSGVALDTMNSAPMIMNAGSAVMARRSTSFGDYDY